MIPLLLTLGALSAPGLPSDDPLSIGEQLSGRSLARDLRGSRRSYDELRGEEGSVLVFLGIECPLANLYLPRVNELGARYHPQGIRFVAVYSGENETAPRVAFSSLGSVLCPWSLTWSSFLPSLCRRLWSCRRRPSDPSKGS